MFGCLCWEVITGKEPFHSIVDPLKVVEAVRAGASLANDFNLYNHAYPKKFIQLMKDCHKVEHKQRPSFTSIKQKLSDAL
jgi:hypothetical protein